jgi:hypothetical protein
MGNSPSRNRRERKEDNQPADTGGKQRSIRRTVSNFVRRRTGSALSTSRVRPKSWRRQPPAKDVDHPLDSVIEAAKDETPAAGPLGDSGPLNVPESSPIVTQSVSTPDALPAAQPPTSEQDPAPEPSTSALEDFLQTVPSEPQIASTTAATATNHQFPPPGTIVVVQGVVHTTDSLGRSYDAIPSDPASEPRRRALSAPRPFTPTGAESRNPLNNRLRRPRPASTASFDHSSRPIEALLPPPAPELHTPSTSPPLSEPSSDPDLTLATSPNASFSSSSVEILGNLLRYVSLLYVRMDI